MSCQVDCLSKGSCGRLKKLPPGAVYAPFIEMGVAGGGSNITVGNRSQPGNGNSAAIKSLEYGFSNGTGVKVEIIDVQGSNASRFMEVLNKTVCRSSADYGQMKIDFGWIIQDCNGGITLDKASDYMAGPLYFMAKTLNTTLENGRIKYVIEGQDLQGRIAEKRLDKNQGKEDMKVPLKQAIRAMFERSCPSIKDIRFIDKDEKEWNFKNSDGGKNGPKSVWTTDNQNALATVRKWIAGLTTENGKGILFKWKQDEDHPVILLLEDPNPGPNQNDPCCKENLGTYIVGGGNCSPVLQFTPNVEWVLAGNPGAGGVSGGGGSANSSKIEGTPGSQIEQVGTQWAGSVPTTDAMWRSMDQQAKKTQEANAAHAKATKFFETPKPIEAELKIVGDPSFAFPLVNIGKSISIIVINPFYIASQNGDCDWLAKPSCHAAFTNKKWRIKGVNHQIREGSYVTTLNVFLEAPNADIEPGEPLGGKTCGSTKFKNDKSKGNKEDK